MIMPTLLLDPKSYCFLIIVEEFVAVVGIPDKALVVAVAGDR